MIQIGIQPDPPAPEDEKHVQDMVHKAEGTEPKSPEESLLAGKYKTEEDLAKGILELLKREKGGTEGLAAYYKELESSLGKKLPSDEGKPAVPDKPSNPEPKETPEDFFDKYTQEFTEKGNLSEDSYKALETKGYPKAIVDRFIEGQLALQQQYENSVMAIAGGSEAYPQMVEWAAKSLSPAEIQEFNSAVNSGNLDKAKLAVEAVAGRWKTSTGSTSGLVEGSNVGSPVGNAYQSWAEVTRDMADPRYDKDRAYQRMVEQKMARSMNNL